MSLSQLIDQIINDPHHFNDEKEFNKLIQAGINYEDLRSIIRRIYDINEDQLYKTSNANIGSLGKLNRKSTAKRYKLFNKKVDNQQKNKKYYRIYAEGDSWFQFPIFIRDIIDWLNKNEDFLIFSDAYGGDWITNILYEGQYISGLSTYRPEFFLISGGGNDLVGSHRLAIMVDQKSNYGKKKYLQPNDIQSISCDLDNTEKQDILSAQEYVNKEFWTILQVFKLQYTLLFNDLYSSRNKHNRIISITQGYDFPFPTFKRRWNKWYRLQPFLNLKLDSGNWLYTPLMIKGIMDPGLQRSILKLMIFEFNEMMITFSQNHKLVFHVDSRKLAGDYNQWFDELHLTSKCYRSVACAYEKVIRDHEQLLRKNTKVVRSVDFNEYRI